MRIRTGVEWGSRNCMPTIEIPGMKFLPDSRQLQCSVFLCGSSESRKSRQAPVTMEESAKLKSGQW